MDAFAISSYLSARNPEHDLSGPYQGNHRPAGRGHELSTALGFNERTITAILNARLISSSLTASLKRVQAEGIKAPQLVKVCS